jgi:hypothetical protein
VVPPGFFYFQPFGFGFLEIFRCLSDKNRLDLSMSRDRKISDFLRYFFLEKVAKKK